MIHTHSAIWKQTRCTCGQDARCCQIDTRSRADPYRVAATRWLCMNCIDQEFGTQRHGEAKKRYQWRSETSVPYAQRQHSKCDRVLDIVAIGILCAIAFGGYAIVYDL